VRVSAGTRLTTTDDAPIAAANFARPGPTTPWPTSRERIKRRSPSGGALAWDIRAGTLPNVGLLTPNLIDDAHDGTLG